MRVVRKSAKSGAVSTGMTIFLAALLKGALAAFLVKKGWWPDWEARALKREEHKRVLRAYEHWCERTGTRPAADPRIVEKLLSQPLRGVRATR